MKKKCVKWPLLRRGGGIRKSQNKNVLIAEEDKKKQSRLPEPATGRRWREKSPRRNSEKNKDAAGRKNDEKKR